MEIRSTDLETERCLLRDWTCDDEPRVLDIYSRWEVARWLGADPKPMEGPEQAARFVERCNALNHEDPVARRWAVERRDDGVVLGTVILVQLPEPSAESGFPDGRYEVGWHFHPDSWGHGYATETARAAITWGFGHGLEEIFAVVRPDNTASLNVCKRLDMREHGRTGAYYGTELELFSTARADQR
ncbi:MAG TPA: GNAT family N-acetyltransferase [Nocardioidaceae bacterium]|nr:GNAT family N-acetyltransferase [Nocardioidaceae bacterium]